MIKRRFTIIIMLVCLVPILSLSQDKDPTREPPLLTFKDLQKNDLEGPFRIEAYVIQTYKCPSCPEGAQCKPCLGDHIVTTDDVDEKDPSQIKRLRIFTSKPEQFEMKKKYSFLVKVRGKSPKDRAIENVDLISFDRLKE